MERRRQTLLAAAGAALGLGAPLGWIALSALRARRPPSLQRAGAQIRAAPLLFAYLTAATAAVFALFGRAIGRREDLLEELAGLLAHDLRDPAQALIFQVDLLLREAGTEGETHISSVELRRLRDVATRVARVAGELLRVAGGSPVRLRAAMASRPARPAVAEASLSRHTRE